MMTTNKLTKTFASGSLAIGVLAGAVLTATSASAMIMTTWGEFKTSSLEEGDKRVTYQSGGDIISDSTMVAFGNLGGGEYQFSVMGMIDAATSFTYTIDILPAFPDNYFTGVQLDSDVNVNLANGGYGNVQKRIAELPTLLLTSTDGDPDPFSAFYPIPGGLRTLTVTDTLIPNPGGSLTSLSNKFTQGTKVPEPGTILGLLAVGGLGLVSRFGKQK
jgi:hypothetical protein